MSTVVAEMPSKSKSPNTTMRFFSRMASTSPSATSASPGISKGLRQSRSSEGLKKRLAARTVVMPRATRVVAMKRGRPRSCARRATICGSASRMLNWAVIMC